MPPTSEQLATDDVIGIGVDSVKADSTQLKRQYPHPALFLLDSKRRRVVSLRVNSDRKTIISGPKCDTIINLID
jgi:hypothetical protein